MARTPEEVREEILRLTREYARETLQGALPGYGAWASAKSFRPGEDPVPYAGRVFTEDELVQATDAVLDSWFTLGPRGDEFQRKLARFLGVRHVVLTNSGSSANLLAVSALTSPELGARALGRGDEVITVAAGFPTTVAPLVQNGLVPVFIDSDPRTLNLDVRYLEDAFHARRSKAVLVAHTLGIPFDVGAVRAFCEQHDLWLIEDNCDALGSRYAGQLTGSFGDMSTQSFYPPHHVTLGEGGAVNVRELPLLKRIVESFRDWGRDCWCASGCENTCGKRFEWELGELPRGYDHKFIYSHLGYNLKPLDIQAAIGLAQLEKLRDFVKARRHNWSYLRERLDGLSEFFDFTLPTHARSWVAGHDFSWVEGAPESECSWFGFMLLVKDVAPFSKVDLARYLDSKKVGNRMLFGGNLVRQPVFRWLESRYPNSFRVASPLTGADRLMNEALFIGVYPGLTEEMLDYVVECIHAFVAARAGSP